MPGGRGLNGQRVQSPTITRPRGGSSVANVALVNLASLPMPGSEPIFPIGLRCIQDALERQGHATRLIDFVESPEDCRDLSWLEHDWDVIGFTIRNIDPIDITCETHVDHYVAFLD